MKALTRAKPPQKTEAGRNRRDRAVAWMRKRAADLAPFATLLVLVIFFSITADSFLTVANLLNILAQVSVLGIVATGMTFVLLCAEIDLSVASVATMCGIITANLFLYQHLSQLLAILIGLLACIGFGVVAGWGTAKVDIPSFMMTLVAMQAADGVSLYISKGQINYHIPPLLIHLGSDRLGQYIGKVPVLGNLGVVVLVAAVVLLIGHLVLKYTRFGRYIYMTGGNRTAAELSGINTKLIIGACIAISALCAGFAGLVSAGRLGSAQPDAASTTLLLDSITAVVLGGTSLMGGRGSIGNTVLGLFIFGVLGNGLDQLQTDIYLRVLVGALILFAALLINSYALKLRSSVAMAE
jgi:ribose transport system permease protein